MNILPTSDPISIVLVDPSDFTMPYDLALAGAIAAQGREVRLVGQVGDRPIRQPFHHGHFYPILASSWASQLPAAGVRLVKGACHGIDMFRLLRWLITIDAKIAHFQWSPLPPIDWRIIRLVRHRMPVVLTLHDSNPYQGGASWLMRQGYANLLRIFNAIIVHTQQAYRRVAAMGVSSDLIYMIPHGLLGENAHLAASAQHLNRDRLVLLQFGKIKPYKGVDLLLQALALVPKDLRERLDVRIVGKPYMDTMGLRQLIQVKGLASCVTLRFEFVSEAEEEELFAQADAIVLPYREIDASGVAMSAIARGLPVLATAIDGFRELFEVGGGARLVPPADKTALAKVITDWITHPQELCALARAMRFRRASVPSWNEIARRHIGVYQEAHARWLSWAGRPSDNIATISGTASGDPWHIRGQR